MLHFRTLDAYRCAVELLPISYDMAKRADGEMANQLRRAGLSIGFNIAEGSGRFGRDQRRFYVTARGSALECGAILDAMRAVGVEHPRLAYADDLIVRIVQMLTKMIARIEDG
jgi:four helix bundle protein